MKNYQVPLGEPITKKLEQVCVINKLSLSQTIRQKLPGEKTYIVLQEQDPWDKTI